MCVYIYAYIDKNVYIDIYIYRFRLNLLIYPVEFTSRLRSLKNSIYKNFVIYTTIYTYIHIFICMYIYIPI